MHPLFNLIATRPHMLAEHAEAYAELVSAELGTASASWKRGAILNVAALSCLVLAVSLAGVALMFWAVIPLPQMQAPWALIAVPLAPLVIAAGCLLAARTPLERNPFDTLRKQVKADIAMLREVET